ncbi:MAG TPA: histidine phosphatase family protein [Bacillota bacterium]
MMREPKKTQETVAYLVRHAQTSWNAEGRFQGQMDTALSPAGQRQATALGKRLGRVGPGEVYSSDLTRASQTAEAVAGAAGLRVILDRSFREVDVGRWQGLTFNEVREQMPESFAEWQTRRPCFRFPAGESYEEAAARALRRLEELTDHPGDRLVVVSHGGLLRALIYAVLGLEHGPRGRLVLDNASISAIAGQPGRWRLVLLNDTCHLESPDA